MQLIILLLLEVQDELNKNFDVEKVLKFISSFISSLKMFKSSSKLTDVMSFKTEDDITWLQKCWKVNFFAMI